MNSGANVRAIGFERRVIFRSAGKPGVVTTISFFPGERGKWYIGCEELSLPERPLPRASRDHWYAFGLPEGYDKSEYLLEQLILESTDNLQSWRPISRNPVRYQHSAGSYGMASPEEGCFVRFVWRCYALDDGAHPGEICETSADGGATWHRQPALHDSRFASYAHRLRTLSDGTLALALPLAPVFNVGQPRLAMDLDIDAEFRMHLVFSCDRGKTWTSPLPIYGGEKVPETDFVELPSGDLLCINHHLFSARAGRQIVYRTAQGFVPGPYEIVEGAVPETVCLTEDGIMVGCLRGPRYFWSDNLGKSWQELAGIPDSVIDWRAHGEPGGDVYQPWMQYLGNGKVACAGHYGSDDPVEKSYDNYAVLHIFDLQVAGRRKEANITLMRNYNEREQKWDNVYVLALMCEGEPLAGKEMEVWYVERWQPGFDQVRKNTLEQRMRMGGKLVRLTTDSDGRATLALPEFDETTDIHHAIQIVARFNADRSDPGFLPAQSLQYMFYSRAGWRV